jgi:hypothetical protein
LAVHTVVKLDILETEAPAFKRQQPLLEGKASGVADETAGCADNAMARNDERGRVGPDGLPHGARGGGVTDFTSQFSVRSQRAVRDAGDGVPNRKLERCPAKVERQVEPLTGSAQILTHLGQDRSVRLIVRNHPRIQSFRECRERRPVKVD